MTDLATAAPVKALPAVERLADAARFRERASSVYAARPDGTPPRILVMCPNSDDLAAVLLACMEMPCGLFLLNADHPRAMLSRAVEMLVPDWIALPASADPCQAVNGYEPALDYGALRLHRACADIARASVCTLSGSADATGETMSVPGDVVGLFTSGSTGVPKTILHAKVSLRRNAALHALSVGLKPEDRVLLSLPMSFSSGFVAGLVAATSTGCDTIITSGTPFPMEIRPTLGAEGVTMWHTTPFTVRRMVRDDVSLAGLERLRCILVGGEHLPARTAEAFRALVPETVAIGLTYGLTEAGPRALTGWMAPHGDGILRPLQEVEARTVNGALRLRTPTLMLGLLQGGQLVPARVDAEGFYDTGDRFESQDGGFRWVGRREGLIARHGETVDTEHIGTILMGAPLVHDAVVRVVCTTDRSGEPTMELKADIVLAQGATETPEQIRWALRRYCRAHLRRAETPDTFNPVQVIESK